MSAVRMVAYGVLELKHQSATTKPFFLEDEQGLEALRAEAFERDQLRKLVNDELSRYGLLLRRAIVPRANKWRTKLNEHVLYGQLQGQGWLSRPVLAQGSFKECCEVAAKLLDELEASQVPDTRTSPHET